MTEFRARPRGGPSHTDLTEFRGAAKRRTRPATELTGFRWRGQGPDRVQGAQPQSPSWQSSGGAAKRRTRGGQGAAKRRTTGEQEQDKAQPRSPATELTEFRGAAKRNKRRTRGGQGPATEPSHSRQGRGAAAKRRTRGGQGLDTEPSHRVDRARPRGGQGARPRGGQGEDKAQPRSPATELTELRGAAERRTRGGQGLDTEFRVAAKRRTRGGQGPATEPSHRVQGRSQ